MVAVPPFVVQFPVQVRILFVCPGCLAGSGGTPDPVVLQCLVGFQVYGCFAVSVADLSPLQIDDVSWMDEALIHQLVDWTLDELFVSLFFVSPAVQPGLRWITHLHRAFDPGVFFSTVLPCLVGILGRLMPGLAEALLDA